MGSWQLSKNNDITSTSFYSVIYFILFNSRYSFHKVFGILLKMSIYFPLLTKLVLLCNSFTLLCLHFSVSIPNFNFIFAPHKWINIYKLVKWTKWWGFIYIHTWYMYNCICFIFFIYYYYYFCWLPYFGWKAEGHWWKGCCHVVLWF